MSKTSKTDSSQHKLEKRRCPNCHINKEFPSRNEACSSRCAGELRRKRNAKTGPDEVHDRTQDSWTISLDKTRIHTLEAMLDYFQIDLNEWEVERFLVNKWEIGRKDKKSDIHWHEGIANGSIQDNGQIFVEPLYQVKAWLKRKVIQSTIREEIEQLKRSALGSAPIFRATKYSKDKSGYLLELSIPDLHLGKLAWHKETGWGDYDVQIAERVFNQATESLIARTNSFKFDRIIFVVGNDVLNTNNLENTTAAGTPVTSDHRYYRSFKTAREMLTQTIEKLRQVAPVLVIVIPGNHDTLSTWHLGDSLECYFHKCREVRIENTPTARKYLQWGRVMLMWTHPAKKGRREDYPLLMATERPEMFGKTKFREIHVGDLHQVSLEEQHGIRVRILPSLCTPDDWHSWNGFVGNVRGAEAYVWSKNEGLVATAYFSVTEQGSVKLRYEIGSP